jgi:hypothetical protein
MAVEFRPLTAELLEACAAFNSRLRAGGAAVDFYLPESLGPGSPETANGLQHLVAVDEGRICGGYIEAPHPGWVAGQERRLLNIQSPLSEGLINTKYVTLAVEMLRNCMRRNPLAFAVGMGGLQNRFARMLKAAGWSVEEVPFWFRMCRPAAVLRELRMLRQPKWRHHGARLAAVTGLGPLAIHAAQSVRGAGSRPDRSWELTPVAEWDTWADSIWAGVRPTVSLSVCRDRKSLASLYPRGDPRLQRYLITRREEPAAWVVASITRAANHRHFGNLTVASLLDAGARPGAYSAAFHLAVRALAAEDVDLIVGNFTHASCTSGLRRAGFWPGPSNYLLAVSPALAAACGRPPVGTGRAHFTRGDGDGRSNL